MVDRYLWTIVLTLIAVAVLTAGVHRLNVVEVNVRNHFNENDPYLVELEKFEATYAVSASVLVVVAPQNDTIFTREAFVAIENLTETLWRTPTAVRVDSLTNYLHSEGTEEGLIVEQLVNNASLLDSSRIEQVREIALTTQEIAGRFVSRDGRLAGLIVSFVIPENNRVETSKKVVDDLNARVNEQRAANPEIDYHIYGEILLNRGVRDALNEDMATLAPIAFAMMALAAILFLRSFWSVLAVFTMLLVVVGTSFGVTAWIGLNFYEESGAALFILMAIATAHSVHLIQAMRDAMREGVDRRTAITHSLQANLRPIFLTSLTTMIGFLSLNFSEMPPFRVMGNIVALGAVFALFYRSLFCLHCCR